MANLDKIVKTVDNMSEWVEKINDGFDKADANETAAGVLEPRVTQNESDIADHEARITQNETDIGTSTLVLSAHDTRISANVADIGTNAADIDANELAITALQGEDHTIFPKTEGTGIKVDLTTPTFPWRDLIGLVLPSVESNPLRPTLEEFQPGVKAFAYNNGDELVCSYHIPHDWVPGTDGLIHLHWGHNGTAVSGNITVDATVTYGDRDGVFGAPVTTIPITFNMVDISTTPQYAHYVTEVPLFTETPTANELDRSLVEVDGIVQVTFKVDGTPDVTGGEFFIFTGDIHYQSTGIGTKQNASPFYT